MRIVTKKGTRSHICRQINYRVLERRGPCAKKQYIRKRATNLFQKVTSIHDVKAPLIQPCYHQEKSPECFLVHNQRTVRMIHRRPDVISFKRESAISCKREPISRVAQQLTPKMTYLYMEELPAMIILAKINSKKCKMELSQFLKNVIPFPSSMYIEITQMRQNFDAASLQLSAILQDGRELYLYQSCMFIAPPSKNNISKVYALLEKKTITMEMGTIIFHVPEDLETLDDLTGPILLFFCLLKKVSFFL